MSSVARCVAHCSCLVVILSVAGAVGAGAAPRNELTRLIDSPTAGVAEKGRYGFDLRLFPDGGVNGELYAGALSRLTISIAYGAEEVIGAGPVDYYPRLEAGVRYRLFEESKALPGCVVGYETRGYGPFDAERYRIKSKGLFLSFSKNYWSPLGQFGVHAGVNRSFESGDGDENPSGWVGLDKTFNQDLVGVAEYDLGLNDDDGQALGSGEGYLNVGVRLRLAPQLEIGALLRNVLECGPPGTQMSRELAILYSEDF